MNTMSKTEIGKLLVTVEKRRSILENAVMGVVKGFSSALFVWGPPGLGKSHLLTTMLDGVLGKSWRHHTAHSTPKALMMSLIEARDAIHLFEDCEKLLKTDLSASLLRAACGAPNERDRHVTYETANERHDINFTGGIIIATNANLSRSNGPLSGVASRFRPIRWDLTTKERCAMILRMAESPAYKAGVLITEKECKRVACALIEMTSNSRSNFDLDLRLFTEHALPAFAQAKNTPGMKWEDLLLAKLSGVAETHEENQAERTKRLSALALKIHAEGGTAADKVKKWQALTELGKAIYYRHLRTAKKSDGVAG